MLRFLGANASFVVLLFSLVACENGAAAPKATASAASTIPATPAPVAPAVPVAKPQAPALTSFAAVDLSTLDPAQKAFFTKVANDEVCPCDCPKSFGACLQEGTKCAPAVTLAKWVVGALESGIPGEVLQDALTRELTGGFSAQPKTIDVAGFGSKGSKAPKYTIVEYADFECPHCKAASSVVEELIKKHPEVKVIYKHFPMPFHPMARQAAIAAEAASLQGKFWQMHDAIFATQTTLSDELLIGHAKALGLDIARFQKDIADPALAAKVDASRAEGKALGIDGTPAFYVNGRAYSLLRSVEGFELRLEMEEQRAKSSCQ